MIAYSLSLFAMYLAICSGVCGPFSISSFISDFGESKPKVELDNSFKLNFFSVILTIISSLLALFLKKNNLF